MARLSPDGKRVAQVATEVARIWNAETGASAVPLPGHNGPVTALLPTADDKRIISAGADLTVREWAPRTGKEVWRTTFARSVAPLFVTPEGVVVQEFYFGGPGPGSLLDPRTGKRGPLPGALGEAKSAPPFPQSSPTPDALLAMTPDGKSVVTLALHTPALRVWVWPGGELRATLPITPPENRLLEGCQSAQVTPDGKHLVALVRYRSNTIDFGRRHDPVFVERWNLATGKLLAREGGDPIKPTESLIPFADGVLVRGPGLELRDAVSGLSVVKLTLSEKQQPILNSLSRGAVSPDGRILALGEVVWSNKVWLFEMRTGRHFRILTPDGRTNSALRFLPDGRLVTGSDTALVWSIGLQATAEGTEELATLWTALAEADPMSARPAMAKLAGRGARAVEFIRGRVKPVPKLKVDVGRIVQALDSDAIKDRDAASTELDQLGAPAVAAVKAQLRSGVSDEVRTRAGRFLEKYDSGSIAPEELQVLRAIEVLEVIGSADARAVLEALAAGEPSASVTRDAAGAVRRLKTK
jgi:WD40 repeat protein